MTERLTLKNLLKEAYGRYAEFARYLIVGGLTTVVSLASYYLCVVTLLDPARPAQLQAANIVSWIAAVAFAYFANRRYVFRSAAKNIVRECFSFYSSRLGTLFVDMLIMYAGVIVLGFDDKIVKIVVQFVVTVLNYILGKFVVFH